MAAMMSHRRDRMRVYSKDTLFAVARLSAGSPIPPWATSSGFWAVTKTADELSIICEERAVPMDIATVERGFRLLAVEGPLDFSLTGVMASIAGPLADVGVSLFAISTFDTDYIMVRNERLSEAVAALRAGGWEIGFAVGDSE